MKPNRESMIGGGLGFLVGLTAALLALDVKGDGFALLVVLPTVACGVIGQIVGLLRGR